MSRLSDVAAPSSECEARRDQAARFDAMSPQDRLRLAAALSGAVTRLSLAGIRRDHPTASDRQLRWHLARRRYGAELADAAFGPTEV